ncbi:hypothetical protein Y032_0575g192 [Ancylostoma ceylanicum]|uniref:Uncharacterized protein n=1 Tax=Ancylostoma ceylanicum TaxID=53326 RepID=A0A016WNL7_9BILA|nr:hypothetical protein Y032_0575g192 [Ancylostoma ceylanicum]
MMRQCSSKERFVFKGKNVNVYTPLSSRVVVNQQQDNESKVRTKPRSPEIPEEGIVVIYAADMRKFNEWVQCSSL